MNRKLGIPPGVEIHIEKKKKKIGLREFAFFFPYEEGKDENNNNHNRHHHHHKIQGKS